MITYCPTCGSEVKIVSSCDNKVGTNYYMPTDRDKAFKDYCADMIYNITEDAQRELTEKDKEIAELESQVAELKAQYDIVLEYLHKHNIPITMKRGEQLGSGLGRLEKLMIEEERLTREEK